MNTWERLNAVIDYAEKHITEKLDLNDLAEIAYCSLYDFQRMFMFIAEMSVAEYIRKRRLTLAGLDLQQYNAKVIDTALKYGYESPVSFARAFQSFHGVTPSEAKKSDVSLKIFPRLIFQIIVKEVSQMIRADKITVNGKEYEASYFGEHDISSWSEYTSREFWRLENAFDDFKDEQKSGILMPYPNYPMNVEIGEVFVMDLKKDGSVERFYYISDGETFGDITATSQIRVDPTPAVRADKITVSGKEYEASYFGEHDISSWSEYTSREFWRLENAFDDFKDKRKTGILMPYPNYPLKIEIGDVFVIDLKKDDSVERLYYISDGAVYDNFLATSQIVLE